jgi:hypothetical protein
VSPEARLPGFQSAPGGGVHGDGGGVDGKTVAESFASRAAFHKAQVEIHEYQRFQKLCADLVAVNQKICRLRAAEKPAQKWSAEEKKRLLRSIRKSNVN